ncbi:MAG: hypothetical protein IJD95_04550 [Clostridia bacterium]|nr:hypothetical protein [Clostridia bacterium]MBR2327833.1 hypothetical protein [Clostridia bacterium]
MKKLKFLLGRIFDFNYKAFFKTVGELHKTTGKSRIWLFFDIIGCGLKYGAGYADYKLCDYHTLTDAQRKTYVSRGMNNSIVAMMNDKAFINYFEDKRVFNETFSEFIKRKWINMQTATEAEFEEFLKGLDYIITKPADASCGKGIEKLKASDYKSASELYGYLKSIGSGIAEECVVQHGDIAALNPYSVNTLRIVTLRANGKPNLLYGFMKIGTNKAVVDNMNSGGFVSPIDLESGILTHPGYDMSKNTYTVHPDTKREIVGFQIPYWSECAEMCLKAAEKFPEVGYVGWDVAITENGPLLIEGNPFPGHVFLQLPPHVPDKIGMLPRFKQYIPNLK